MRCLSCESVRCARATYGGLDMAVMDVFGGSMAWHCQYEPPDKHGREDKHQYAARILAHHWPNVPNLGDLTQVDWADVEPIDVLTAGFPCTDLSYAGLGAGIKEGTRSGLWLTIADAIGVLRPRLVVLENVAAIVVRRPGMDVVLGDLARLGFDAEWACVRASDVGAPHVRERWFLLAWPADADGPGLEGAGPRRAAPQRGRVAADAADLGHEWRRLSRNGRPGPADCDLAPADAHGSGRRHEPGEQHGERPAECLPADIAWGRYEGAIRRWERILGRPAPSPVMPGQNGNPKLNPWFSEWMMGLPEGHVCGVPAPGMTPAGLRNARLKAIGNGVVRQQAAYALRLLSARAGVRGVAA